MFNATGPDRKIFNLQIVQHADLSRQDLHDIWQHLESVGKSQLFSAIQAAPSLTQSWIILAEENVWRWQFPAVFQLCEKTNVWNKLENKF